MSLEQCRAFCRHSAAKAVCFDGMSERGGSPVARAIAARVPKPWRTGDLFLAFFAGALVVWLVLKLDLLRRLWNLGFYIILW